MTSYVLINTFINNFFVFCQFWKVDGSRPLGPDFAKVGVYVVEFTCTEALRAVIQ